MSTSKSHQNHLKLQPPFMMNDSPLHSCEPSSYTTKTDASSPFQEEMFSQKLCKGSFELVYVHTSRPYDEFYASMVEMVISKLDHDHTIDWGYMGDLLHCYLELNAKNIHEYIEQAFFDVMEVLNIR